MAVLFRRLAVPCLVLWAAAMGVLTAAAAAAPPRTEGMLTDIRPQPPLWGTVVEMPTASQLVLLTPNNTRLAVRLLGVEPPVPAAGKPRGGAAGQPYADETLAYARDLLLQKQVLLEAHGKDQRGRLLAVVFLGDINVNLTLVKEGLAWVSPDIPAPTVRAPLEVAERQAQVARYGLWSQSSPEAPWEFRKRHRLAVE